MSLIIKGMKLPKKSDCRECSIAVVQNRPASIAFSQAKTNLFECFECAEIPTPHGRLIDDFKLLRALIKAFPNQSMNFYDTLEKVIDEAPTIIEAEGVNE